MILMDNGLDRDGCMQVMPVRRICSKTGKQASISQHHPGAAGVKHYVQVDPFDFPTAVAAIQEALTQPGVRSFSQARNASIQRGGRQADTSDKR
jgi:hypothetical protein